MGAESLTFNKITTGAQNDLDKVTKMAYSQIREFGFNKDVGLVSFDMSGGGKKPYSKQLAATMDLETRKLIAQAYKRAETVLLEHKDKLEILAQRLLEVETLNYDDVVAPALVTRARAWEAGHEKQLPILSSIHSV